jgi:hypothetical protein
MSFVDVSSLAGVKQLSQPVASSSPSAAPSAAPAEDTTGFKAVDNERESVSGETLLVAAYAAVWLALMVFVVAAWRRTRSLEDKVSSLEKAVEKAIIAGTPSTKRSTPESGKAAAAAEQE